MEEDKGHELLIADLTSILVKAEMHRFHDFHENGFDAPKVSLVQELRALIELVKSGAYDN